MHKLSITIVHCSTVYLLFFHHHYSTANGRMWCSFSYIAVSKTLQYFFTFKFFYTGHNILIVKASCNKVQRVTEFCFLEDPLHLLRSIYVACVKVAITYHTATRVINAAKDTRLFAFHVWTFYRQKEKHFLVSCHLWFHRLIYDGWTLRNSIRVLIDIIWLSSCGSNHQRITFQS